MPRLLVSSPDGHEREPVLYRHQRSSSAMPRLVVVVLSILVAILSVAVVILSAAYALKPTTTICDCAAR